MEDDDGDYAAGDVADADQEMLMDHCAMECMHAIEGKDVGKFRDSFHPLIMHTLNKMGLMGDGE